MTVDVPKQSYRGVLCMSCRQPIPLPAILNNLEAVAEKSGQDGTQHEQGERVFSLRCRACGRERPYRSAEIIELEGAPRPRIGYVRSLHGMRHRQSLSRAANG
jgi:hypothetical protein